MLQFGHDVGVVETRIYMLTIVLCVDASIRPRRWSRGDYSGATLPASPTTALQFGHDVGVVETKLTRRTTPCSNALQFGHDVGVVETERGSQRRATAQGGFNSATTLESWRLRVPDGKG